MEEVVKFSVEHKLTVEDIKDILTTAIEGGIGYWACLLNDTPEWIKACKTLKESMKDTPCYCDVAWEVLSNNEAVKFEDEGDCIEDDEAPILELTKEKLLKGCALYTGYTGKDIHESMEKGDFDANDADMIIQFALFGELMYG